MSVGYTIRDGVALISIENPPVNSISAAVRVAIASALEQAQRDPAVVAAVLLGGNDVFCGGAEVREFNTPFQLQKPTLPELNVLQDSFGKPLVAAIAGFALGGGLEIALGCHWRVAHPAARLGLPEVTLGLMPGSGGSQRLPRLMPMTAALEMMVTGEAIDGRSACEHGLVDAIAQGDLQDAAVAFANSVVQRADGGLRRVRDLPVKSGDTARREIANFKSSHPRTPRTLKGVEHVLEACEAAATLPFAEGLAFERERFLRLLSGPEFKALSYAFFAMRQARKVEGLPREPKAVRSVALMGVDPTTSKLAIALATCGIRVSAVDPLARQLDTASMADIAKNHDLVVLAAVGSVDARLTLLHELTLHASEEFIVATTGPLSELGKHSEAPLRLLGLQAPRLERGTGLLEVARGPLSSVEHLASVLHLGRLLGFTTVLSEGIHGFLGQRMFRTYLQHAAALLEEGCTPSQVDIAMEKWGMERGPFALAMSLQLQEMGSRTSFTRPEDDLNVQHVLDRHRANIKIAPRSVGDEEIVSRLTLAVANEAARLIGLGATAHASNVDAVWLAGYGFPSSRGGPLFHVKAVGLGRALASMKAFAGGHRGEMWAPSEGLLELAGCHA